MKKTIITALLALVALTGAAQPMPTVVEKSMKSEYFKQQRQVLIYTPWGYNEYTATRYDVIYVFDSQERAKFDLVHSLHDLACPTDKDETKPFIIVGICSPSLPEYNYSRNADYLPMPIHQIGKGHFADPRGYGHSADLKKFLKNELMPYIDRTYRTSGRTIGIGHSLSASFVLDCMITYELFDDYIAMSPNYSYDEFRLANDLENYPWMKNQKPRFIYTSMGNEKQRWGETWDKGWQRASAFLSDKSHFPKTTIVSVKNFPNWEHNPVYVPSLTEALNEYLQFSTSFIQQYPSKETYPVRIELVGQDVKGDVYITGNQSELGNWDPKSVKMQQVNDSTCAIELKLHLPAYFKFTRGDWDHQALLENASEGNQIINKADQKVYTYRLNDEDPWY